MFFHHSVDTEVPPRLGRYVSRRIEANMARTSIDRDSEINSVVYLLRVHFSMVVRAFSLGTVMGSCGCCHLNRRLKRMFPAFRHVTKGNDGGKVKVSEYA